MARSPKEAVFISAFLVVFIISLANIFLLYGAKFPHQTRSVTIKILSFWNLFSVVSMHTFIAFSSHVKRIVTYSFFYCSIFTPNVKTTFFLIYRPISVEQGLLSRIPSLSTCQTPFALHVLPVTDAQLKSFLLIDRTLHLSFSQILSSESQFRISRVGLTFPVAGIDG